MRLAALFLTLAAPLHAEGVTSARYDAPTDRYAHGVLGDAIEWGALVMRTDAGRTLRITLPETRVFEDTAPRLADVDGDGDNEVLVVESDLALGARLSVYDPRGLLSVSDFIGRANRWLAPVGAADLDGDGTVEIAWVDRPHLAKTLRVFAYAPGALVPEGDLPGVTNHRIGETDIAGGLRDCGRGPEMVVADADWRRVLAVRWTGTEFETSDLGPHRSRSSFARALAC